MATPNDDQVRFDVLIEAKAALKSLQELLRGTEDNRMKIIQFTQVVVQQSKLWGISWQQALNVYKQLNAELSKQKQATVFGQTGGQDLFKMSEQYLQAADSAGRLEEAKKKVGKAASDMGDKTEHATKRMVRGLDIVRIAAGALVAMFIFNVINAIQMTFRKAIELATQYEDTLYRLRNVEESLSLSGIEISMKGLKKGIEDIQKLLPIFSKEDVAQLVGTLAISTKQLGLNEQQILDLAKAIGVLNIRSEKQEELSVTAQHVLSSLLTGNAKGITSLGIAFTDNVMRAKAMELGFLKAGDALSTLTENEKGLTKLQIILESTGGELSNVGEYLDSNSAKLQQNRAAWNDVLTTLGQIILPFLPVLTQFFDLINGGLIGGKVLIVEFVTALGVMATMMALVFTGQITSIQQFTDVMKTSIDSFRETMVNKLFSEVPDDAPKWFMKGWGDLIKEEAETATSGMDTFQESVDDFDASGFEAEIEKILEDMRRAQEDLEKSKQRKAADIDTEYQRKALDAETDYLRKVQDINQDAEREMAEVKRKHRQEDENAEAKYQLALWELRMRFLMSLEDALHARDARQVIRLQKQYAIDKEALKRKHDLENKERNEQQQAELEDIELKRQQRLADARLEYEQKLADQQLAKQRELEDLNVWYQREQADLELATQRKLQTLIDGWIEEQKITESNAAQVYAILSKYFGPGGMTDALYQYMMQSLLQTTAMAAQAAASIPIPGMPSPTGGQVGTHNTTPSAPSTGTVGGRQMAEGGTLLATRPTKVTFGEKGPEVANFVPLGRLGQNVGKFLGDANGRDNGISGSIALEVLLSPDLEARIVRNSMDGVADVVLQVVNTK